MKIVIQNPHLLGDSLIPGIHDYLSLFINKYKPTISINPFTSRNIFSWFKYLKRKNLPLTGWNYLKTTKQLKYYDVWLCFSGTSALPDHCIPSNFFGLKLYHVMDYNFHSSFANECFLKSKIDYLIGYGSHDHYCPFFQYIFKDYKNKVIPFPFGISDRFKLIIPFKNKEIKASVMGAVNRIANVGLEKQVEDYKIFYSDLKWGYPNRQMIRENMGNLDDLIISFLASEKERVNLSYDSVLELNKYKFFVNEDSIKHYLPARTYEGTACGSIMVGSDHPCYNEFGWHAGYNYLSHKFANFDDLKTVIKKSINDIDLLNIIQKRSLTLSKNFRHHILCDKLYNTISKLYYGDNTLSVKNQFRRDN